MFFVRHLRFPDLGDLATEMGNSPPESVGEPIIFNEVSFCGLISNMEIVFEPGWQDVHQL